MTSSRPLSPGPRARALPLLALAATGLLSCTGDLYGPRLETVTPLGNVRVTVVTAGSRRSPDGYAVSLDAGTLFPLADGDTVIFRGLAHGTRHTVSLLSVPANCVLFEGGIRLVQIEVARSADVEFVVTYMAPGTGALRTRMTTPGVTQHSIRLDGGSGRATTAGELRITDVEPGVHVLRVDVAQCPVNEDQPPPLSVLASHISEVTLTATCVLGDVVVQVETTGQNFDTGGYLLQLAPPEDPFCYYLCTERAVGTVSSTRVSGLPPYTYRVGLTGVSANCAVAPPTERSITVISGAEVKLAFAVVCR